MTTIPTVPATDVPRLAAAGANILDVREPGEHAELRLTAPHAFVPLGTLDPQDYMLRHGLVADDAVYMLCRSGKRATTAAQKFVDAGYKNIFVIEGGILACQSHGVSVEGAARPASCAISSDAAGGCA